MPSARQAFVPTPLMNTSPQGLREYVEGNDPIHGRPFMAEVFDQLTRPVPGRRAARRGLGPVDSALRRSGRRGGDARTLPGAPLHGLPADRPPDRGARRADADRNEPRAGRDGRQAPSDDRHGVLALRRREGRGERRDGRRRAGASPGHPRARVERGHRAPEQHVLDGEHGRRQRADPPRDRHEQRRRRAGAVQLRELGDRPGVRTALPEPPGRLGAGRLLRRLAGLQLLLQLHHLRRERGGEPLGAVPRAVGLRQGRERRHGLVHLGERLGRVPARLLGGEARRR